jgi:hypothetical protein
VHLAQLRAWRSAREQSSKTLYVGLDVHKESILKEIRRRVEIRTAGMTSAQFRLAASVIPSQVAKKGANSRGR